MSAKKLNSGPGETCRNLIRNPKFLIFEANRKASESIAKEAAAAPAGAKGKVHNVCSNAMSFEAQTMRRRRIVADGSNANVAVRQFFRPYVLAFVALAVMVGGWSYGYKLSQYFHHSEVSRASYSRIWVDHRNDSIAAPSPQRVIPNQLPGSEPPRAGAVRDLRPAHDLVAVASSPARRAFIPSSLIPFRAPPSSNLSLA
jgi:hypothetical protein